MAEDDAQYKPHDTITQSTKAGAVLGTAGLLMSAVQNTLSRQRLSAMSVFTRTGITAATFLAMGTVYEFGRCSTANLRQKDSSVNHVVGGMLAGSILGVESGRTASMLGYGALVAVVMGTYDYVGGRLSGSKAKEADEFQSYDDVRKNYRRPIDETLSQLGEGRGIYGPGYKERRRLRLEEKYGIEIPKTA